MIRLMTLAVIVLLAAFSDDSMAQSRPVETPEARDRRMAWWREARFGMFIHWGLYAIPGGIWNGKDVGGVGEWIMTSAQIPVAEYEPLVKKFNPVEFDADAWVGIAADAGMKYVVITSKHHDGFCLFDSELTDYDIASTPFRRDVLRELSAACAKRGIRLGFYHSIMDWHHPDYLPRRAWDRRPGGNLDAYVAHMKGQIRELVSNYGIELLWFDGEWEDTWTHERGVDLAAYVRSLRPSILINNRVDKGREGMAGLTKAGDFAGDFGTPEQEVPARGFPGVDWESCMTMNDTWGWKARDENWKSAPALIRTLVETASKGGNFLLSVGPTAAGVIPGASVERLRAMGAWLRKNGESIYGTSATPFPNLAWRCTAKPGRLFVHLAGAPPAALDLPLANVVSRASVLSDPESRPLALTATSAGVSVSLAGVAGDEAGIVIAVDVEGVPTPSHEARLAQLGIQLPPAPKPLASYVPAVRTGNLIYLAGQGPIAGGKPTVTGKVGAELTEQEGYEAARAATLVALAALRAEIGSLDRVRRIVKVVGYVNSAPGFTRQPWVVNGASDLLIEVFGEAGRHARSAIGANELPLNIPVEVEIVVELVPDSVRR